MVQVLTLLLVSDSEFEVPRAEEPAYCYSLLEIALEFEQFRQKHPYNKDPTWFLEKIAEGLCIFTDQLQGVSNLPEADRRITSIGHELLAQTASVGPFVRFRLLGILLVECLRIL